MFFFFIISGERPYPDVRSRDLPNWLKQNKHNTKPEYCDDSYVLVDRTYSPATTFTVNTTCT